MTDDRHASGWRLTIRRAGAAVIVAVHGQLEAAAAARLDHVLRDLICDQGNLHVAIDLGGVSEADTNGVDALIAGRRLAGEHRVTLVLLNTPPAIEQALDRRPEVGTTVPGPVGRPGLEPSVASTGHTGTDDHVVGLYASDDDLAESVCEFLLPALRGGRAALVVATADHRRRFEDELRAAGVDVDNCRRCGQYVSLDASETLTAFMVDGLPDGPRFDEAVGGLVRRMAATFGGIRIYGEMVAVLWADGNVGAAFALEELWNQLRRDHVFELLCAYPASFFAGEDAIEPLRRMCDLHTRVLPSETVSELGERHAVAVLEGLEPDRNEFLAMVVHDIRTPTVALSEFLATLRDNWAVLDEDRIDTLLSRSLDNVHHVERLAADLLTVAHLESEDLTYNLGPVDLADVASRAVVAVRSATGAAIDLRVPDGLPLVRADETCQVQILSTLLTSAVTYSPPGAPVVVTVDTGPGELVVSVIDAGPGVRIEEAGLFQPFPRESRPERWVAVGTGLALYIAKSLVEGQGGAISVRNDAGSGCTFSYTVPTAEGDTD